MPHGLCPFSPLIFYSSNYSCCSGQSFWNVGPSRATVCCLSEMGSFIVWKTPCCGTILTFRVELTVVVLASAVFLRPTAQQRCLRRLHHGQHQHPISMMLPGHMPASWATRARTTSCVPLGTSAILLVSALETSTRASGLRQKE